MWILKNIPSRIRAQLINDLFAFSQANLVDPLRPFTLLTYLANEDEYLPWRTAIDQINNLQDLVDSTPLYGQFRIFISKLVTPIYAKLGWDETINNTWLDRQVLIDPILYLNPYFWLIKP